MTFTIGCIMLISVSLFGQFTREGMNGIYSGKLNHNDKKHAMETIDPLPSKPEISIQPKVNYLHAGTTAKQKLNSLVVEGINENTGIWGPQSKKEFIYSPDSNLIHLIESEYILGQWVNFQKFDLLFDHNGYHKQVSRCKWNTAEHRWVNFLKYEYTYDNSGKLLLFIQYDWRENLKQWIGYNKYEFAFNEDGHETLNNYSKWNNDKKEWVSNKKTETTYDLNGNKILSLGYMLEGSTNQLYLENRYEKTFNIKGLCSQQINYFYPDNSAIAYVHKKDFTYDTRDSLTLSMLYILDNFSNTWRLDGKAEYTYNAEGYIDFIHSYQWDEETNLWMFAYKSEYQWDQYGHRILDDSYAYFYQFNRWEGIDKNQYAYDEKGNKLLYYDYHWDQSSNQWLEVAKYNYDYDENGNLIGDLWHIQMDLTTHQYGSVYKSGFSYDSSLKIAEILMPPPSYFARPENRESIVNKPIDYIYHVLNEDIWQAYEKGTYYYSLTELPNLSTQLKDQSIKVYPNPASTFIRVEIPNDQNPFVVDLFDLKGKLVLSQKHLPNDQIAVSQLKQGMYFYKISGSGETYHGKVVIK